jgi:hypothetical protein
LKVKLSMLEFGSTIKKKKWSIIGVFSTANKAA